MTVPINVDMLWVRVRANDPDSDPATWSYTLLDPVNNGLELVTPVNASGDVPDVEDITAKFQDLVSLFPLSIYGGASEILEGRGPKGDKGDPGSGGLEFYHNADGKTNGPINDNYVIDSGQNARITQSTSTAQLRHLNGQITNTETVGNAAGYLQIPTAKSLRVVGVRMTFRDSYSTDHGVFAFGAFSTFPPVTGSPAKPIASCHLGIGTHRWELAVFVPGVTDSDATVYTVIDSGTFATPLVADNVTTYTAECYIDTKASRLIVLFPDGSMKDYTHAGFAQDCRYAFFECFRAETTDQHTSARFIYGSSVDESAFARAEAGLKAYKLAKSATDALGGAGVPVKKGTSFTNGTSTLYSPPTLNVPSVVIPSVGPTITCVVGANGKARVDLQCWVESSVNAYYLFTVASDGATPQSIPHVVTAGLPYSQNYAVSLYFTGLAPGTRTFTWQHWEFDIGRPLIDADPGVRVNEPLGQRVIMFAEPLA